MALKKSLMVAGALATVGLASAAGLGLQSAAAENSSGDSLAQKIAQKFNLNQDEVNKVFEEHHSEKEAEMQSRIEEKLSKAVEEGKLTEDQKSKILTKLQELRDNRPDKGELENMTSEQRKAHFEQKHEELQKWAEENDIPEEYLRFVGPGGPHRVKGHGGGMGFVVEMKD